MYKITSKGDGMEFRAHLTDKMMRVCMAGAYVRVEAFSCLKYSSRFKFRDNRVRSALIGRLDNEAL